MPQDQSHSSNHLSAASPAAAEGSRVRLLSSNGPDPPKKRPRVLALLVIVYLGWLIALGWMAFRP